MSSCATLSSEGRIQFANLFFGLATVAYVANRTGNESASRRFQRTQTDFDREFGAVLAAAEKFEARAHLARLRRIGVQAAMANVLAVKPLGHQHLDRLAYHLFARIAEEAFGLRIDELDVTLGIDDHHRVGSRFQQIAESLFFFLALRDVADRAQDERLIAGFQGTQADFDREFRSVLAAAIEVQSGAHGTRARRLRVALPVPDVRSMIPLWYEALDRLAD